MKNLEKDSSGRYIAPRGMEKVRVPIWNSRGGCKIVGTSAPTMEMLNSYLAKNTNCHVYTGQKRAYSRANIGAKRATIWDRVLKQKYVGRTAPFESNLEAYLKKHPNRERYVGQDKVTDESGVTKLDDSVRGPVLLNLKCGKLMSGTRRPLKRKLSQYLEKNPHLVVYDSENRHHQEFLRDAKQERKIQRLSGLLGRSSRPRYPAGYTSRLQTVAGSDLELDAAVETMEFVGLDGNAISAVAATENEDELDAAVETTEFVGLDGSNAIAAVAATESEELDAAVETTKFVGLDDDATSAVVASTERDYLPNCQMAFMELEELLGWNEDTRGGA